MFSDQEEAQDILSFFQSSFKAFREKPIVLYGLGINTKVLIHNLKDFHIVGVMDAKHEGETLRDFRFFRKMKRVRLQILL